jgi:hypothetical protein
MYDQILSGLSRSKFHQFFELIISHSYDSGFELHDKDDIAYGIARERTFTGGGYYIYSNYIYLLNHHPHNVIPSTELRNVALGDLKRGLPSLLSWPNSASFLNGTYSDNSHCYYITNLMGRPTLSQLFKEESTSKLFDYVGVKCGFGFGNPETIREELTDQGIKDTLFSLGHAADAIVVFPTDEGLKVCNSVEDGIYCSSDRKELVLSLSVNLKIETAITEKGEQLKEFEYLINKPNVKERDLKTFFDKFPPFLLGDRYTQLRGQIHLPSSSGDLIPDFFLESVGSELWDILDIKRPIHNILISEKNRERLSSEVARGVAQLRRYCDYFDDPAKRELIRNRYGIDCKKPGLALVIGRNNQIDRYTWQDIKNTYSDVQVVTYDELMNRAKKRFRDFQNDVSSPIV